MIFSILLIFLILVLLGAPIAFSLGISVLSFAYMQDIPLSMLAQLAFSSLDSFSYIAIPMFVLVGNLMETGGLSRRLIHLSRRLLYKLPGSLGAINVLSCAFFGAISGSASATTAAIGGMLIPEMRKRNYPPAYSGALSATAGTLGAIIPPSIVMIIYAITAEVSVGDMFLAGLLPGIIIIIGLIIVNSIYTKINHIDLEDKDEHYTIKDIYYAFWHAKWALLSPFLILGGIYSGVFTATEAAVIATIYSFIIGFLVYRELTVHQIYLILKKTCRTVGSILIIVPFASILATLLTLNQIPQKIGVWVLSLSQDPTIIILLIVLLIFISGMFLDATPLILIYTPLFLPILKQLEVSPIHFGIIITIGAMIGAVTPPVGVNLFIGQAIAKADTLSIMRIAILFIAVFILLYIFIAVNPRISTIFI